MAITIERREISKAELLPHLHLDPTFLDRPEAQIAHHRGLLTAKSEALRSASRLTAWARPLLVSILIVSFLHLWHQIARITPEGVPALSLPAWAHWLSAALLTASIDATALYLVATRSVANYARLGRRGQAAVWFFYLLTAMLNSVFVLSYTPGLPPAIAAITPVFSLVGALLLGVLVPVSIAAVEHARQVADAARLALLVEVEVLRGLVAHQLPSSGAHPAAGTGFPEPVPVLGTAQNHEVPLPDPAEPVPTVAGTSSQTNDWLTKDATAISPEEAAMIRALAAQGMSRSAIASELGGRRADTLARIRTVLDAVTPR
jgi:hypothetical protein